MASGLHPLRTNTNEETSSTSPEALLISAMLEHGMFDPAAYHVIDTDIEAWKKLWLFGVDYQSKAGEAPPVSLISKSFPDFELTPGINARWAASKVHEASAARTLRRRVKDSLDALTDEDMEGAFSALEGLQRPRAHRKQPADVFDHATMTSPFDVSKIEVPYRSLMIATKGGIGPGELWYLAARLGEGKSWELMGYAAKAAKAGYNVCVVSLEMPAIQVATRSLLRLANGDPKLTLALNGSDHAAKKKAMDQIALTTPGSIKIIDPSHGRINTTTSVSEMCHEYDLVIIDHAGLLMTADGKRAIDDWRSMALISNILREITLSTGTPILAAAQINREGGRGESMAPPKASNLSQSDALGQDADVLITMKRLSPRVMIQSAEKVRSGPNLRWHTQFDPAKNKFEEISPDKAIELRADDESRMDARMV